LDKLAPVSVVKPIFGGGEDVHGVHPCIQRHMAPSMSS
jgi:hypothetical protein